MTALPLGRERGILFGISVISLYIHIYVNLVAIFFLRIGCGSSLYGLVLILNKQLSVIITLSTAKIYLRLSIEKDRARIT